MTDKQRGDAAREIAIPADDPELTKVNNRDGKFIVSVDPKVEAAIERGIQTARRAVDDLIRECSERLERQIRAEIFEGVRAGENSGQRFHDRLQAEIAKAREARIEAAADHFADGPEPEPAREPDVCDNCGARLLAGALKDAKYTFCDPECSSRFYDGGMQRFGVYGGGRAGGKTAANKTAATEPEPDPPINREALLADIQKDQAERETCPICKSSECPGAGAGPDSFGGETIRPTENVVQQYRGRDLESYSKAELIEIIGELNNLARDIER